MESTGSSNGTENEGNSYLEKEAKKVRVYIHELRERLIELQNEGEEIERTTETILGERSQHNGDDVPARTADVSSERKIFPASPVGAVISEAAGFTSLLRKFESMRNGTELPSREEPEEIRLLRLQNGTIRDKIKQIQARIERAQMYNSPNPTNFQSETTICEYKTCSHLYEAAEKALNKVDQMEAEILSVESIVRSENSQNNFAMTKDRKIRTTNY